MAGAFALGFASWTNSSAPQGDEWATKLIDVPAVVAPPAVPAGSVRLAQDTVVLGVSVGESHRAYVIDSMSQSRSHVVNVLIDGVPVTVAYCDRTNCARAFTTPDGTAPLELAVGGWFNEDGVKSMVIRVGSHRYLLSSGQPLDAASPQFPYEDFEVELDTWGEWRTAHPNTDVYLGNGRTF